MRYDFDLIVIGGGAAGLVASKFAAGVGKRVALIEKDRLGGECTLHGCVPSKTLIRSAKAHRLIVKAGAVGLEEGQARAVPDEKVLTRTMRVVERVYEGHGPEVLEGLGIRLIMGSPRFCDNHRIEIEGRYFTAKSFIVCTGSSPLVPPVEGIESVRYSTNQDLFDMKRLPRSMIVVGGGPVGIEMAQAFTYLGVKTTVIEAASRILQKEDEELSDLLAERLIEAGLVLRTRSKAIRAAARESGVELTIEDENGRSEQLIAEALLVASGRKANTEDLGLEAAGVAHSPKAIIVDRKLRTTTRNIFACGDVTGMYQFSHMAEYQARIAAWNALFPFRRTSDYRHYVWCTFSDPEFAHAGLTEAEARERYGSSIRVYKWAYRDIDRGKTDAEEFGMAKIICDRSYRIVGAHILGSRAGELIQEAQIIKTFGIPFHRLDSIIHVYPTFSDVIKQPAKACHIDKLRNSLWVKVAERIFGGRK